MLANDDKNIAFLIPYMHSILLSLFHVRWLCA